MVAVGGGAAVAVGGGGGGTVAVGTGVGSVVDVGATVAVGSSPPPQAATTITRSRGMRTNHPDFSDQPFTIFVPPGFLEKAIFLYHVAVTRVKANSGLHILF